MYNLTKERLLI